ncbi:FkbM family methyltransferase [Calothrix sp. UHCC 0171]|uniref:FkbM family methyltransferase n=1 Tax=Calothrix sp. UHCC 0171 TaxID=3110245 RepID=UPI002B1FA354|nr:FkbM family methyltransferase [Calothrix sp. UHCC 0171]MEA5573566.1 FkbM family methyltransferase [Calothrix sp. UHCC 0171]
MATKQLIRKLLPPSVTIHLMAALNYRQGEPEIRLLKSLVDPQKDSIDIGANKGIYTYFLAKLSRQVFAYEPNPELAEVLAKSVPANVSVHAIALSNTTGEATLSIPLVDNFFYDQLGTLEAKATNTEGKEKTYQVPLQKLDDCQHSNIGFIKIDVEGHEEAVIDGAYNLLITQRPNLLIEIEQKHHPDKDIFDIFERILNLGYEGFFLLDGELKKLDNFDKMKHQNINNYQGLSSLGKTYICNFIFKPQLD